MRGWKKPIQVVTVGVLATFGAQAAIAVAGVQGCQLDRLSMTVGVPSALAAAVFFPVSSQAVATRWALMWRVVLMTAAVCLVNRLLVLRPWSDVVLAPLIPSRGALDPNARMLLAALGVAAVFAALAQPLLRAVARGAR